MFLIVKLDGSVVVENASGFVESNAVLFRIRGGFLAIPLEAYHTYIVFTTRQKVNALLCA